MDQLTLDALVKWKTHRYRPTDLPFAEAVDSLTSRTPLIEAKQSDTRKTDWVLCRAGTTTPATFVFAGVFAEADPYYTGNFVPKGEPIPAGLDESRVAHHAGYKPAYSYAIETYHDKDIWELHAALDAYMVNVAGFNTRQVKRRQWQSGSTWHWRYYFRVPMFLTCESRGGRPEAPSGLHAWVVAAHQKSRNYRANPIRPSVCGLENGRLQRIEDCTPAELEYGDIISLVFTLAFVEDRDDWGPVTTISHVIRVQHADKTVYKLTQALLPNDLRVDETGLSIGTIVDPSQVTLSNATSQAVSTALLVPVGSSSGNASGTALPAHVMSAAAPPVDASISSTLAQAPASSDNTARDTSHAVPLDSGSEMEVDDEGGLAGTSTSRDRERSNDDGDSGSSGASTLADAPPSSVERFVGEKSASKKRARPPVGSDDDGGERGPRQGRPSLGTGLRRGGKVPKGASS